MMKALIFNSGIGNRLGDLTECAPKAMVRLSNGESIYERQLRILSECGISEFIVTCGPFAEQLQKASQRFNEQGCVFHFVQNDKYAETNSIYSMWLARDYLKGNDAIILHGDLVFDADYAKKLISDPRPSLGSVDPIAPLSDKDFKARVSNGKIVEISVAIFDNDCVAFQPLYKLSAEALETWLIAVEQYIELNDVGVYAENAANEILQDMNVEAFSYEGHLVKEIDTVEDLTYVSEAIRHFDFAQQPVFVLHDEAISLWSGEYSRIGITPSTLNDLIHAEGFKRPLLVCGKSFDKLSLADQLQSCDLNLVRFSDFTSNPTYEEVLAGLNVFRENRCDSIISVGGGSAIDIAKCIKAFSVLPEPQNGQTYFDRALTYSPIKHLACPTTAGTGSESTHFAVIYLNGIKQSLTQDCLIPDIALLAPDNLLTLSYKQRVATFFDALCQAIESYWSLASTEESREYCRQAISILMANYQEYLCEQITKRDMYLLICEEVAKAANLAGKAINLTTTTAAHAMSYKLTSLYGIPHGLAVAMCLPYVWRVLIDANRCPEAKLLSKAEDVQERLNELAGLMCDDPNRHHDSYEGLTIFVRLYEQYVRPEWVSGDLDDIDILSSSVNTQRLDNFPLLLSSDQLKELYKDILGKQPQD